jgi:hypothetical protein
MSTTRTSSLFSSSNEVALGPNAELMCKRGAFILGDTGSQFYQGIQRFVSIFSDFIGGGQAYSTTVVDGWRSRKGTTNTVDWTVTPAASGTVVGTIGDTTASMAVSGVQLDAGLSFKPNQGDLVFEARVALSAITNIAVFVGLTDQTAALEMPIQSAASADTITTNATDGVGFMFDTSMATDTWWLVGVANNVDSTHQNSAAVPVANTFQIFRIEVTSAGVATFYINGTQVGTAMTGATTATVALTPVIAGFNRTTTGTPTLTADYLYTSAARA